MVIYDKNQFAFNTVFLIILVVLTFINIYYATNFRIVEERFLSVNESLSFNFIQGTHSKIEYALTEHGFLVRSADNYGVFNGPSMQPTIFDQNIIIEKQYDGSALEEGQVVRFMRGSTAVVHRVRADYGDTVYVQGDSLKDGEIISKSQITHVIIGVLFT
jgi:hypothetical protein